MTLKGHDTVCNGMFHSISGHITEMV